MGQKIRGSLHDDRIILYCYQRRKFAIIGLFVRCCIVDSGVAEQYIQNIVAFTLQQWLSEHAQVIRCTYISDLVTLGERQFDV